MLMFFMSSFSPVLCVAFAFLCVLCNEGFYLGCKLVPELIQTEGYGNSFCVNTLGTILLDCG